MSCSPIKACFFPGKPALAAQERTSCSGVRTANLGKRRNKSGQLIEACERARITPLGIHQLRHTGRAML